MHPCALTDNKQAPARASQQHQLRLATLPGKRGTGFGLGVDDVFRVKPLSQFTQCYRVACSGGDDEHVAQTRSIQLDAAPCLSSKA